MMTVKTKQDVQTYEAAQFIFGTLPYPKGVYICTEGRVRVRFKEVQMAITSGDWILYESGEPSRICKAGDFNAKYEPVKSDATWADEMLEQARILSLYETFPCSTTRAAWQKLNDIHRRVTGRAAVRVEQSKPAELKAGDLVQITSAFSDCRGGYGTVKSIIFGYSDIYVEVAGTKNVAVFRGPELSKAGLVKVDAIPKQEPSKSTHSFKVGDRVKMVDPRTWFHDQQGTLIECPPDKDFCVMTFDARPDWMPQRIKRQYLIPIDQQKFKVGDRVVVVGEESYGGELVGKVGMVCEVKPSGLSRFPFEVQVDGRDGSVPFREDELILDTELRVGDRVRVKNCSAANGFWNGKFGKVVEMRTCPIYPFLVHIHEIGRTPFGDAELTRID